MGSVKLATVVNLHHTNDYDVYVGRGRGPRGELGVWGNPYSHLESAHARFHVATREEAVEKHRWMLFNTEGGEVLRCRIAAGELAGKVLACYCKPSACHGDLLAQLANAQIRPSRIDKFDGEYRFLSNFFIEPDGTHVEGEYQATKCVLPSDRKKFQALDPWGAKKLGRAVQCRSDWEAVKTSVMAGLVRKKFVDHPQLAAKLVATSAALLVEGNWWCDTYWGRCGVGYVCKKGIHSGEGENVLGELLEGVRDELA